MESGKSASLAELVTRKSVNSLMVRSGRIGNVGAELVLCTTTWNERVALRLGVPLSVTRTVTMFVLGSDGVHVNKPLLASMAAPAGAPASRVNVNVCGGWSVSVALIAKLRVWLTVTSWLLIDAVEGGRFANGGILGERGVGAGTY